MRLGYCCINLSLRDQGVTINRGMVKKTWMEKGKPYAGELAFRNLLDLLTILKWNQENGIQVYRMSSDIFPWMSEYQLAELPNFRDIQLICAQIGKFVNSTGMRISFHPGQFDVLASPTDTIVEKTIFDLDQHSTIMDLMEFPQGETSPINIHIGGSYGDKFSALDRFCKNFKRLSHSTQSRLVVENDDKASQYSVQDLFTGVYEQVGTPITFDHFHHRFCQGGLSAEQAAHLAASTWKSTPLQHYSSSKALYEDVRVINRSHADWIYETIPTYGINADVEIEAKMKDFALIKYRNQEGIVEKAPLFDFELI
jgi:UV DNA damage endonuclease